MVEKICEQHAKAEARREVERRTNKPSNMPIIIDEEDKDDDFWDRLDKGEKHFMFVDYESEEQPTQICALTSLRVVFLHVLLFWGENSSQAVTPIPVFLRTCIFTRTLRELPRTKAGQSKPPAGRQNLTKIEDFGRFRVSGLVSGMRSNLRTVVT